MDGYILSLQSLGGPPPLLSGPVDAFVLYGPVKCSLNLIALVIKIYMKMGKTMCIFAIVSEGVV